MGSREDLIIPHAKHTGSEIGGSPWCSIFGKSAMKLLLSEDNFPLLFGADWVEIRDFEHPLDLIT